MRMREKLFNVLERLSTKLLQFFLCCKKFRTTVILLFDKDVRLFWRSIAKYSVYVQVESVVEL